MITGELADVRVNVQVPLIAAELGYWQLGIDQASTSTIISRNNRPFIQFDLHRVIVP